MNNKQKGIIIRALGVGLFIIFTYLSTIEINSMQKAFSFIVLFIAFYLTFPLSDNIYDTKDAQSRSFTKDKSK